MGCLCPGSRESNKAGACGAEEQELCNFASLGFAPVIIILHEGCGLAVSQWRNFEAEVSAYHYNIHPINLTLVIGLVVSVCYDMIWTGKHSFSISAVILKMLYTFF